MVDISDPDVELDENGNVVGGGIPMGFDNVPISEIEAAKNEARKKKKSDDFWNAYPEAAEHIYDAVEEHGEEWVLDNYYTKLYRENKASASGLDSEGEADT